LLFEKVSKYPNSHKYLVFYSNTDMPVFVVMLGCSSFVVTENIPDRVLLVEETRSAIFPRITVRCDIW